MASAAFEGTYTAIVTPFRDDAEMSIDETALAALVAAQLDGGVQGVVPCGTTGESPALSADEQGTLIRMCVELVRGRAAVIAGTGSNATKHAIALARAAEKAGANAVMVVVPYYNKPSQDGLRAHFVAVAGAVDCPVIVYNIPSRTGVDLAADTLARICEAAPNVVATKEATGNVLRAQEIARLIGPRITILSGDDALTLPMIASGARGVISVTSNVDPSAVARATSLALDGDFTEARRAHLALCPVHEVMFVESNPAPAKAALAHRGLIRDVVRPPLVRASEGARARVLQVMEAYEGRR